ncbi:MAG: pyrroline-5-carboxylate reductase [Candidatus Omnitrophica bacterium]|nr:pyrroline-5-carboxylate reductase [Candidatus Omnitrophota bacterium]
MLNKTFGIIGVGNMGMAILEGVIGNNIISNPQVWVYDKISEKVKAAVQSYKVNEAKSLEELAQNSEIILLAVKPQDLPQTAKELELKVPGAFSPKGTRCLLISILAGTPLEKIRASVGPGPQIVRAMPNLGAKVGEAITALTSDNSAAIEVAEAIFQGCGKTICLEEKFFDLVTAVSGSGPAYFFLLMELLAQSAAEGGIPEREARLLAVQTAVGAGLLAQQSQESPKELRKKVTSKGGTTEAALKIMYEKKLPEIIKEAVQAALTRGKELSQK